MTIGGRIKHWFSDYRWYRRWKGGKWYLLKSREVPRRVTGVWSQTNLAEIAEQVGQGETFRGVLVVAQTEDYTNERTAQTDGA
jgi:hypothetical protein